MEEIKAGIPEESLILKEASESDKAAVTTDTKEIVGVPESPEEEQTVEATEAAETTETEEVAEAEGPVEDQEAESLGDTQVYDGLLAGAELAAAIDAASEDGEDAPDLTTEVSVDDLESKINASTVITTGQDEHTRRRRFVTDDEENGGKKRKPIVITLVLLLLLAGLIAGAYFLMYSYFSNHFYSGTYINGMDVSGMTVAEVKQMISDEITTYSLTIKGKDGLVEVLDAEKLGWSYNDDNKVDEIMSRQEPERWFMSISKSKAYNFNAGTKYDKDKALASLRALDFLQPENIIKSEDAYLTETETGATITPEIDGNEVMVDKLESSFIKALDNADKELDMTNPDLYIHPQVFSTDESMNRRMNDWNAMLAVEISYSFGDNVEPVDKAKIASSLRDDGQNVTVDTTWIRELVSEWAKKYDTFGKERQFKTHSGSVVTIPAYTLNTGEKDPDTKKELTHTSDYGWLLDEEGTVNDMVSAINDKISGSRQPVFKYSALGWDNGDLTGNYVEVSLTEQHLWVYQNGQVVVDTPVVTGKPEATRATYAGCYAIDAKKAPATLGTVATQGYSEKVAWWVPFDGGRGLHDAPWRGEFGGQIYLENGSHGCVNCPPGVMERIYNAVTIGEAVVVY
ncbi:MAG: L,D-transpeptidase family protein [Lachnospiraceae bacterium]|nr:L,D-transpeptidase family protein [Candidatus Equihabitans merdae]